MLVTGCCVYLTAPGHGQPLSYFSVFDVVTLSHSFLLGVSHILLAILCNFKIILSNSTKNYSAKCERGRVHSQPWFTNKITSQCIPHVSRCVFFTMIFFAVGCYDIVANTFHNQITSCQFLTPPSGFTNSSCYLQPYYAPDCLHDPPTLLLHRRRRGLL